MQWKWPVTCLVVGTACFCAGRLTTDSGEKPVTGNETTTSQRAKPSAADVPEGEASDTSPRRQTTRRDRPPTDHEPRVSVPLKAVSEILKENQFAYSDFEDIDRKMPDALTILGVSASDKKAALGVMAASRQRLFEEEKKHARVVKADESSITLDRSAMEGPSKVVVEETQKGLRESLPSEVAEALIGSIDWERYYFNGPKTTSFQISRSGSGSLGATTITGMGSTTSGLRPGQYPDDGTPIPAEAVFDNRWVPFLKGRSLLPVNK